VSSSQSPDLISVVVEADAVAIRRADGTAARFHHMWLRDNCACADCGPHASGARLQRLLDIPDDIAPKEAQVEPTRLKVVWANDGHRSEFGADWLDQHSYGAERHSRKPRKTLWDATLTDWPSVEWSKVLREDAERQHLHASVAELGFVLVRGLGTDHDAIEGLAKEIGYLRETHYGRFFDLVTRRDPQILADLAGPLLPHTDEAYRRVPTGINVFHCIQPSGDGGGLSQLVDAHHVAQVLREQHPTEFDLLTRLPVRHERRIATQLITSDVPAIVVDQDGEFLEVRLNERTMTALCLDEEVMESAYSALRTAFGVAYDPANLIGHPLEAGEALIFDNLRVLHGRTGYNGDRHLRQCQVMRDEFFGMGAALTERARSVDWVMSA